MILTDGKLKTLEQKARDLRESVISMLMTAGSGHTAGPLGMADIFAALFFHELKFDPKNPTWSERDRLILSNGHICPILYAAMAHAGYFPVEQLKTLRKYGSHLQGHPHREYLPGVETSSGPLGSGLSQAVGMCLADRMDNGPAPSKYFYCLMSDGELECGQTWEAVMLGAKYGFHNLIAVIDRNNIQIDGYTEDVMPLDPVADKFKAFNWHVKEIDGHNFEEIIGAIEEAKSVFGRPTVIIANTIPGKGVASFERKFEWHGKPPSKAEGEEALRELETVK